MSKISSVLIANRGEIACRIISTCKKLGIRTVAVYSDADDNALHTRLADEAHFIGDSSSSESYLGIQKLLDVAAKAKVDAIHPGYGFLSESSHFAKAVQKSGLIFIGPTPQNIELAGDKVKAKEVANKLKVPTSPSVTISDYKKASSIKEIKDFAKKHGFPLLVKAAAGGGGRGMRKVFAAEEFEGAIEGASREAMSFFGDPSLFIEKFLDKARHVEVQIFGDRHGNVLTFGTRDCSLQRNHQKVIEEAPASGISASVEKSLLTYSKNLALEMAYENAGTVEFLVKDEEIYFLEINSRLQVEHTVTEEIFGVDLVELQIKVAQGESIKELSLLPCGHAIQLRLCAENPRANFIAETGRIGSLHFPVLEGLRVDTGFETGGVITPFYDSLIAKLIVRAKDRPAAISLAKKSCGETQVVGVLTNSEYLQSLLSSSDFVRNSHSTVTAGEVRESLDSGQTALLPALSVYFSESATKCTTDGSSSWTELDFFRIGDYRPISRKYTVNGNEVSFSVEPSEKNRFKINEAFYSVELRSHGKIKVASSFDEVEFYVERFGMEYWVNGALGTFRVKPIFDALKTFKDSESHESVLRSPLPGKVLAVKVKEGQSVEEGEILITLESMKMEHSLSAPFKGQVLKIEIDQGAPVSKDEVLLHLVPAN